MSRREEHFEERREVQMQGPNGQQRQELQQHQVREEQRNTNYTHTEVRAPVVNLPPPIISTGAGKSQIFPSA
jgi:hypothetical protein